MEQRLDLRGLEPPEPLERILDALAGMRADDCLRVLLPHEPFPLYALLRPMGYRWRVDGRVGCCELLIWSGDGLSGRAEKI